MSKKLILALGIGVVAYYVFMQPKKQKCSCQDHKDDLASNSPTQSSIEKDCKAAVSKVMENIKANFQMTDEQLSEREKQEYAACLNLHDYAKAK